MTIQHEISIVSIVNGGYKSALNYNDLTATLLQQWLGCKQVSQEETLFQLSEIEYIIIYHKIS